MNCPTTPSGPKGRPHPFHTLAVKTGGAFGAWAGSAHPLFRGLVLGFQLLDIIGNRAHGIDRANALT